MGLDNPIVPSKSTEIIFNCYDAPNEATAKVRIDSGPWTPRQKYTGKGGYVKMQMPHHFIVHKDTSGLVLGKHRATAQVTWPDGTIVTEATIFTVTT